MATINRIFNAFKSLRMAKLYFIVIFLPVLSDITVGLPTFHVKNPQQRNLQNAQKFSNVIYMNREHLDSPYRDSHEVFNDVHEHFEDSEQNGENPYYENDLTSTSNHPTNFHRKEQRHRSNYSIDINKVSCIICKGIVSLIQTLLAQAKTKAEIAQQVQKYCIDFKVEDAKVCKGIVHMFQEEVLTVFDKVAISADAICGKIFGKSCGQPYNSSWNITLPDIPKPPVVEPQLPKAGLPVLKILQLSDVHIDFEYQPGANTQCGEPLCCRKDNGPAQNSTGAGYWGDYRGCDLPIWTLEKSFEHIAKTHPDIGLIYWTGDLPGHNVWNQSRTDQLQYLKFLTKKLIQFFPHVKVMPNIGNHESSPVNSFPPPFIKGKDSISWLYDPMAVYWSLWLPPDTMATIQKGGYYTVLLKPGFRVISLNMNYCNNENWWLLLNSTDPAGQLQWLISVLQHSENSSEKAHILGHIPPGTSDCTPEWSGNFNKIVNRYENVITGMFFGHRHTDDFEIFYDEVTKKRPLQVAYVSPSLTAFPNLNPGYRIYTVDGLYTNSSFYALDHETYIFNLTVANTQGQPQWFKEYSAKETYNMSSLFPRDWDALTKRFEANRTLFDTFYRYQFKLTKNPSTCDDYCYKSMVCDLRTSNSGDRQCNATGETDNQSPEYRNFFLQNKFC